MAGQRRANGHWQPSLVRGTRRPSLSMTRRCTDGRVDDLRSGGKHHVGVPGGSKGGHDVLLVTGRSFLWGFDDGVGVSEGELFRRVRESRTR